MLTYTDTYGRRWPVDPPGDELLTVIDRLGRAPRLHNDEELCEVALALYRDHPHDCHDIVGNASGYEEHFEAMLEDDPTTFRRWAAHAICTDPINRARISEATRRIDIRDVG